MASITINATGKVIGNYLNVSFSADVNVTGVKLSNGATTITATSFTQTSAAFDVSSWSNGTYSDYYLIIEYSEAITNKNINISTTSLTIKEGASATFEVSLASAPSNSQTVTLSVNTKDVTLSDTSFTFTPNNYSKIITVTAALEAYSYLSGNTVITASSSGVSNKTLAVTITDNDRDSIPVSKFGIVAGQTANVQTNTTRFQTMINYCKNTKAIQFPAGDFVFNPIDLGTKNNIVIRGVGNSFASTMQKNINTGKIMDTYTRIITNAGVGDTFFKHKNAMLTLENIGMYNLAKNNNGTFTEEAARTNILMQHTKSSDAGNNTEKGKVFLTNCAIYGWKVAFGDGYTFPSLETELGTEMTAPSYIKQCCVLANKTRFLRNGIAINEPVDTRLIDCSFNKNDYAVVFRKTSGFTTLIGCRIEWSIKNGIYMEGSHEVIIDSCEFDRSGYSAIYADNNKRCTITNNSFRRNGASTPAGDNSDYSNNVHIYAYNNRNCIFMSNNTRSQNILDTGPGASKPDNCVYFGSNVCCILSYNNLAGTTRSNTDKEAGVKVENDNQSIIGNNIFKQILD